MIIFVAGATGAVGRPLVAQLVAAGHEVVALSRRPQPVQPSVRTVVADIEDQAAITTAVQAARPDVIVHQLTALPAKMNPRAVARALGPTNRLRVEGTRALVTAATSAGVTRVVAQSVCFLPAPDAPAPLDDDAPHYRDAPRSFRPVVDALVSLEEQVLALSGGVVLRYGLFYGPGTYYARDGSVTDLIRRRWMPIVGDGAARLPLLHVEDAARAAVAAIAQPEARGRFNIAEDDAPTMATWIGEVARLLGARPPRRVPVWLARLAAGPYGVYIATKLRAVSTEKARRQLGWSANRSWRATFAEDFATPGT